MSGFFCVKKETVARGKVNPIGFKISLEIMARCRCHPVEDVPIMFQESEEGCMRMIWFRYSLLDGLKRNQRINSGRCKILSQILTLVSVEIIPCLP
jgi:dolichol-phosphate mannosyltransferase